MRKLVRFLFGRHLSVMDGAVISAATYVAIHHGAAHSVGFVVGCILLVAFFEGLRGR